jgi:hypothetical protein
MKYIPIIIQNNNFDLTKKEQNLHNPNVNLNYDVKENINTNIFQNDENMIKRRLSLRSCVRHDVMNAFGCRHTPMSC